MLTFCILAFLLHAFQLCCFQLQVLVEAARLAPNLESSERETKRVHRDKEIWKDGGGGGGGEWEGERERY